MSTKNCRLRPLVANECLEWKDIIRINHKNTAQRKLVFLVLLATALMPWRLMAVTSLADFRIVSLNAYLYDPKTGSFQENSIDQRESAAGISKQMMVVVEIAGNPGSYDYKRKIDFRVSVNGSLQLTRVQRIGVLSPEGKFFAAFWIYDVSCLPVTRITAKIVGQGETPAFVKELTFVCGEPN